MMLMPCRMAVIVGCGAQWLFYDTMKPAFSDECQPMRGVRSGKGLYAHIRQEICSC